MTCFVLHIWPTYFGCLVVYRFSLIAQQKCRKLTKPHALSRRQHNFSPLLVWSRCILLILGGFGRYDQINYTIKSFHFAWTTPLPQLLCCCCLLTYLISSTLVCFDRIHHFPHLDCAGNDNWIHYTLLHVQCFIYGWYTLIIYFTGCTIACYHLTRLPLGTEYLLWMVESRRLMHCT